MWWWNPHCQWGSTCSSSHGTSTWILSERWNKIQRLNEIESFCDGYCSLLASLGHQARVYECSNVKSDHLVSLFALMFAKLTIHLKETIQSHICHYSASRFSCKAFMTHASRTLMLFNPFFPPVACASYRSGESLDFFENSPALSQVIINVLWWENRCFTVNLRFFIPALTSEVLVKVKASRQRFISDLWHFQDSTWAGLPSWINRLTQVNVLAGHLAGKPKCATWDSLAAKIFWMLVE